MDDAAILTRLDELGLELPAAAPALAVYTPCVVHGGIAHVSGQVPMVDGSVLNPGHLGDRVTIEEGAAAARRAALQALSVLRDGLGGFGRLQRVLQVTVFVAVDARFRRSPEGRQRRERTPDRGARRRRAARAGGRRHVVAAAGRVRRGRGDRRRRAASRPRAGTAGRRRAREPRSRPSTRRGAPRTSGWSPGARAAR